MFPLSFAELAANTSLLEEKRMLPHRLVFGSYPDVITRPGDEVAVLRSLLDGYLYKDILEFDKIHKPEKLTKLLQAIAYQVGSEVSYNELSQVCGLDPKTVANYITILEQAYVISRLGTFSRNLRNELKSSRKLFFYDNGIRNALIGNFTQIENRTDVGALFENYMVSERLKLKEYISPKTSTATFSTTFISLPTNALSSQVANLHQKRDLCAVFRAEQTLPPLLRWQKSLVRARQW